MMAETNEKCQAGCPHPREAHQTNPLHHEDLCFGCVKDHGGAPNTEDWHPFETIASLRARIAELEGERDELRGLIEASDAGPLFERLDNQHLRIAELEHKLNESNGPQLCSVASALGTWGCKFNSDAVDCGHSYCREHALVDRLALAESERLTNKACVEVASLICSKLGKGGRDENNQNCGPSNRGLVRDLIRAARGVKDCGFGCNKSTAGTYIHPGCSQHNQGRGKE